MLQLCVTLSFASSGKIPDEAKALSLLAPAPTMTSLMPGAGLLPIPTPTPLTTVSKIRLLFDFWFPLYLLVLVLWPQKRLSDLWMLSSCMLGQWGFSRGALLRVDHKMSMHYLSCFSFRLLFFKIVDKYWFWLCPF